MVVQVSGFRSSKSNIEIENNPELIVQEPIGGWKPIPRPRPGSRPGPNYKWTCTNCKCATGGLSCKWQKQKRSKQKKYRATNIITSWWVVHNRFGVGSPSSVILNSWILHLNYISECVIPKKLCSILKIKSKQTKHIWQLDTIATFCVIFWNYAELSISYAVKTNSWCTSL